jgi:hypothetical protein
MSQVRQLQRSCSGTTFAFVSAAKVVFHFDHPIAPVALHWLHKMEQ